MCVAHTNQKDLKFQLQFRKNGSFDLYLGPLSLSAVVVISSQREEDLCCQALVANVTKLQVYKFIDFPKRDFLFLCVCGACVRLVTPAFDYCASFCWFLRP